MRNWWREYNLHVFFAVCIIAVLALAAWSIYDDNQAQLACKVSHGKWTQTGTTLMFIYSGKVMIPTWVPVYECLH